MYSLIASISGLSVLIPATIAFFFRKKILPEYRPFFWCILVSCIVKLTVSACCVCLPADLTVICNLLLLPEALLYTWQFRRWKLFHRQPRLFTGVVCLLLAGWMLEPLISGHLGGNLTWFNLLYALVVVLMSVRYLNQIFLSAHDDLLQHSGFIIAAGFIIYFTCQLLVQAFWISGLNNSPDFRSQVYVILNFITISINLLFGYALIWTDRKQPYTRLY
ncbi:hypothetical protein [Flavihumibacter petaseus]|uniref:Uncharacterized protein n=1 Tax=Flavihumibacter petaseus NBRC 106054 TaxID=1220578 RepID=A0A0E9N5C4_9BACT|nr:hypothetical protein [Flavihumibacter petaseus]GAO44881.1 hypothetical protein FPE01S_04_01240 [Flavihumibacter petaseus NBRC 106054]